MASNQTAYERLLMEDNPAITEEAPHPLNATAPVEPETTHTVYFEWTVARPDPTSYKQLAPEFHPLNQAIAVEVPTRYFLSYDQESHSAVLTPEGMAYASRQINLAISKIMSNKES